MEKQKGKRREGRGKSRGKEVISSGSTDSFSENERIWHGEGSARPHTHDSEVLANVQKAQIK